MDHSPTNSKEHLHLRHSADFFTLNWCNITSFTSLNPKMARVGVLSLAWLVRPHRSSSESRHTGPLQGAADSEEGHSHTEDVKETSEMAEGTGAWNESLLCHPSVSQNLGQDCVSSGSGVGIEKCEEVGFEHLRPWNWSLGQVLPTSPRGKEAQVACELHIVLQFSAKQTKNKNNKKKTKNKAYRFRSALCEIV